MVAFRWPSEAFAMLVSDFDPPKHTLIIREPKKNYSERTLYLEPEWICCASNRPSLANWLTWRAKVADGTSNAMFLKPDGEPFRSKQEMATWLANRVKPHFPWFHGYMGRRWGVNARLIEWNFDYARVAQWTGHESIDMIRREYEQDARLHAKLYGKNWLSRAMVKSHGTQ